VTNLQNIEGHARYLPIMVSETPSILNIPSDKQSNKTIRTMDTRHDVKK
jgi:hypothetical protein